MNWNKNANEKIWKNVDCCDGNSFFKKITKKNAKSNKQQTNEKKAKYCQKEDFKSFVQHSERINYWYQLIFFKEWKILKSTEKMWKELKSIQS